MLYNECPFSFCSTLSPPPLLPYISLTPGGGWCSSLEDCALRTLGPLGSSSDYKSTTPLLLGMWGGSEKGRAERRVGYAWKGGREGGRIEAIFVQPLTFFSFFDLPPKCR